LNTCTKSRANRKQYNKDNPGQTQTKRDKLLTQEAEDNHQTCTNCLKVKHADEFAENDKQFKQCNSCRTIGKEKRLNAINQHTDDHRTCTNCLKVKHAAGLTVNDKKIKYCNQCRNKPKQQFIALKGTLASGPTKVCKTCKSEKPMNQFHCL
jgi:hypothetical protein